MEELRIKSIQDFPTNLLAIAPETFYNQLALEFNMDFKFKGIRKPKEEPPPILNFRAREAHPLEGYEAGEIINSIYTIHPRWSVFARLGLYEQWISELTSISQKSLEETLLSSHLDFENRFKGTMKYGMGLKWNFVTKAEKKLSLEAFLEQKSQNEWILKEYLLSHKGFSGLLFDNWKFTFTFDF